jgi:hypothetical protein
MSNRTTGKWVNQVEADLEATRQYFEASTKAKQLEAKEQATGALGYLQGTEREVAERIIANPEDATYRQNEAFLNYKAEQQLQNIHDAKRDQALSKREYEQ